MEGGATLSVWPPRRSSALLHVSAAAEGRPGAALIVDSYFHLYRRPSAVAPPSWSARARRSAFLGVLDAPPASDARAMRAAPPLPVCVPLEGGFLQHPLARASSTYRIYASGQRVVETGGDAFAAALNAAADAGEAHSDPHEAAVRSLLWHRIAAADRDLRGLDFFGGTEAQAHCRFTPAGRERFCARRRDYAREFEPDPPCEPFVDPGPPHPRAADAPKGWPYCNAPTSPVAVVSYECGIVESFGVHGAVAMNLLSLDGGGHVLSSGFNGVRLPNVTVAEFEELACVGEAVFPSAPGHFLSEILPRLIVLDMLLPEHVPLLWPAGAMPEQVLGEFRAEGVLSAARPFPLLATDGSRPQVQRARRLFTLASTVEVASWSPLILLISHRIMAESIHEVVVARDAAARAAALAVGGAAPPPLEHGGIVVLTRGQGRARSMTNEAELLTALRDAFPGLRVDAFEPLESVLVVAQRLYGAALIIGPHGANLNNLYGARAGAAVIEIAFAGGMLFPSEYFCLARNLGLRYWLSPSAEGEYGTPMRVHVEDVVAIAKLALEGAP